RPEFAPRQQQVDRRFARVQELETQIERLNKEKRAEQHQANEDKWDLYRDVCAVVEREWGRLVCGGGCGFSGTNPEQQRKLESLRDQGDEEELEKELRRASGYCEECCDELKEEDKYTVCNWCREHRGKTHCEECLAPLKSGEEFCCAACDPI